MMNKKQKILAIIGLGLVLFLSLTNTPVRAETPPAAEEPGTIIGGIGIKVISNIFGFVNYIIGFIASILFNLAGGLTQFTLGLNFDILKNPLVAVGWQISRDLANLGFVLFIIIIAIATILRMQQYGAKSALGKLIAVALLVNFSLVFAGVFIDFSNMLTNFFISNIASGDSGGLASAIANAFKIQNLLTVKDIEGIKTGVGEWGAAGALGAFGGGTLVGVASVFFVAIFTLLGAFSLLALAIMFLIRVVALAILLVLVPLVCLFVILPATKSLWDQWWKNFMKWIIFAPAASFFLYLSLAMAVNYGKAMKGMAQSAQMIGTTSQITFGNLLIKDPLEQMGNMIIIIGFMLGGLMAANSMGITGSKAFLGMTGAAGKWARGAIGRKTLEGVGGITGREIIRKKTEEMAVSKIAPVRWLGRGINRLGAQAERVPAEYYKKQIANMSPQRANIEALSSTGVKRAVLLNELIKKKDLSAETIKKFFSDSKTMASVEKDFKTSGLNAKDLQKTTGRTSEMLWAIENNDDAALTKATDELSQFFTPKDYAKGQWNEIFKETTDKLLGRLQLQLASTFAQRDTGAYSKITPQINGKNLKDFEKIMNSGIDKFEMLSKGNVDKANEARRALGGEIADKALKNRGAAPAKGGGALRRRLFYGEESLGQPKETT